MSLMREVANATMSTISNAGFSPYVASQARENSQEFVGNTAVNAAKWTVEQMTKNDNIVSKINFSMPRPDNGLTSSPDFRSYANNNQDYTASKRY